MAEGIVINNKSYNNSNTNEYQRVILEMIEREQRSYTNLVTSGASNERVLKQQGVVEHYCDMLQDFDGIEAVQHMFEPLLGKT